MNICSRCGKILPSMATMRLARRLALSLSWVTVTTLAVSFGIIYFVALREETRELDAALRQEAGAVARLVQQHSPALWKLNAAGVPIPHPLKELLNYRHEDNYVVAYDAERRPVVWSRDSMPDPIQFSSLKVHAPLPLGGTVFDHKHQDLPLRVYLMPMNEDRIRWLLVAVSRADLDDDMGHLRELLAILMILTILSTVGLASWLGHRAALNVENIAAVARRVARGERDARVGDARFGSTELQSLAIDLDHMIAQLSDLVTSQQVFVSHAAHELRTPLTGLRGEIQLAMRRPRSAEEYAEVLASLAEDVEKLVALAEDLLALARVQVPADPEEVSRVDEIVGDAVNLVRGLAQIRQVGVTVTGLDDTLKVAGHRADLARALRNLLENAVVHSPDGQDVTVEIASAENTVSMAVSDHGPGIPPDERQHVFQPLFRGRNDQGSDCRGAGLGLAIALRIVQSRGGNLRFDADYTGGARFITELPRVNALA
jgi:two-component system, OmpR family, sensor kinase